MRILISNDDGVFAKGIQLLERSMAKFGQVFVVAPQSDQSGMSHALTLHRPLRVQKVDDRKIVLDGSPADCVHFAIQDLFQGQKPDLIVSGINHGANLGEDVWYSGTVGAAIEGSLNGIRSVAISVASYSESEYLFDPAVDFVETRLMKFLEKVQARSDIIYNINIPSLNLSRVEQVEFTRLGGRRYRASLVSQIDPRGKAYFWIGGEHTDFDTIEGTDSNAIRQRRISISPIHLNITDIKHLEEIKSCEL